ncbi:SDR family NAD(P)-dependent oxidoreductase [Nocardia cyriacigeorgica]|uniref:short-chain dehydrogenase/reductase n=1 Tax=Nocardia cyriacigeorgica TaxID=135487 RepID=UPI00189342C4|nr:short-chain dehydrogenase/reductase [Nocardia cyriacigeorgica]MBF6101055.1 SDR family NAD(P)-dependent oxidoreductase [Nocardia cyriacigeorgica]
MIDLPFNPFAGRGNYRVAGRTALITGAGQGIGLELAEILYARGASVVLVDIDAATARAAARALGPRAFAIGADVADRAQMSAAVDRAVERFGALDIVVANAGVTPAPATVRTMDPREFDRVLGINLTGVFNTVHPALDAVIAAKGHVVVVSSCAAFAPGMGGSPYMMSKAAVEQLGRALRVELAAVGASAGIAYFGVVETAMTHDMLDADELGIELDAMLPWPLNVRITAEHAARTIADGISRRAARTIAPSGWEPYALLRGAVNIVLDSRLAADPKVHGLIRRLEQRVLST